jgi:hypothetical protein
VRSDKLQIFAYWQRVTKPVTTVFKNIIVDFSAKELLIFRKFKGAILKNLLIQTCCACLLCRP